MNSKSLISYDGIAAPLMIANVDTDVIMPKQFLKGIDRSGLDKGVFFDLRFLKNGLPNPDFILNKAPWDDSSILVVGENFGCGSSREHAVWGLKQLGIKAIIGTSFAGIFFDNCQRNGVLLVQLKAEEVKKIGEIIKSENFSFLSINLEKQEVLMADKSRFLFDIDPLRKEQLILGLDAIDSTLQKELQIKRFEEQHLLDNPWLV